MEFDNNKWDVYVQKQGGIEAVKNKVLENKVTKHCYDHDEYVLNILNHHVSFNPTEYGTDALLFIALGLNIDDFILTEPVQPVQIVTGIKALRALCDGKILKHLRSDVFYKIENNLFVLKTINNTWQKAYSYIDYILIDDFEVCNAASD